MGLEAVLLGYPLALHLAFSPYEVGNIHWGQEQLIRATSTDFMRILGKGVMVVIFETARNRNLLPQSPLFRPGSIFTCVSGMSPWYPAFTSPRGGDQVSGQPLLRMGSTTTRDPIPTPNVFLRSSGVGLGRHKVGTELTSFLYGS